MKKSGYVLLLILAATSAFSQEAKSEKTWAIKLNVPQLFDFTTFPNVSIAVEKNIGRYVSINAEFGYQFYNDVSVDTTFLKPRGFKTNLEARVYIFRLLLPHANNFSHGVYCGIQGFYRKNQYTGYISYSNIKQDSLGYEENYGIKKTVIGANFILGYQKIFFKRLLFEAYFGVGPMNRIIRNTNIEYNQYTHQISGECFNFIPPDVSENSGRAIDFTSGFRIGYKL